MKLANLLCVVFAFVVGSALAGTCTWTGNGGDYKWSTAANWSGNAAPVDGDSVTISATRNGSPDAHAIVNDIKGLTLKQLKFGGTVETAANLTLEGEAIALESNANAYDVSVSTAKALTTFNYCALAFKPNTQGYTAKQGILLDQGVLVQRGKISSTAAAFSIIRSASPNPTFYGEIYAPDATFTATAGGMNFYGKITADVLVADNVDFNLYSSGNKINTVVHKVKENYKYMTLWQNDAFDGAVVQFNQATNGLAPFRLFGHLLLDRIAGVAATNSVGVVNEAGTQVVRDDSKKASVTLRATQGDESWACYNQTVSLTWAPVGDYTLNLAGRVHGTTGAVKVNRGTLVLTQGGCFPNVTEVTVEKDATLDIASKNANNATFSANARLVLATGAKLSVSNGCDLTVKTLVYGGVPVAAKTYAAEDCDWLTGAGSVTVTSADAGATYWKTAASGKWTESDNWTAGVPDANTRAYVLADGADYTVTLDQEVVAPKVFAVRNGGTGKACVKVADGGKWLASDVTDYVIGRNGEWLVDGGWASVSNNSYISTLRFALTGDEGATGCVKVVSGILKLAVDDRVAISVGRWSRFDVTGGEVDMLASYRNNGYTVLSLEGGEVSVSGDARWMVNNTAELGFGKMVLGGTSRFGNVSYANATSKKTVELNSFGVYPRGEADGDAELVFRDQACFDTTLRSLVVGSANKGSVGTLRYESAGCSPAAGSSQDYCCFSVALGNNTGCGRFYMTQGRLVVGSVGLSVGSVDAINSASVSAEGLLDVTNATLKILGTTNQAGWNAGRLSGLAVAYAPYVKNYAGAAGEGRTFQGTVRLSEGGAISLDAGYMTVGTGYGRGLWQQTGGALTNAGFSLSVGLAGGEGTVALSGGTFTARGETYVGGALTNVFTAGGNRLIEMNYPVERHDGTGVLTISGGAFDATYTTWNRTVVSGVLLGQDGDGMIEMVGTEGTFAANYLIASNFVAGAGTPTARQTHSTLKFTFGADGVSPLSVLENATLTEGTRIVVDFSDYAGTKTKFRLVKAGTSDFDVSKLAATFVDANAEAHGTKVSEMTLVKDAQGLLFKSGRKGLVVVVR